jgi:hypothetical protein
MSGEGPKNRVWLPALAVLVVALAALACGSDQETQVPSMDTLTVTEPVTVESPSTATPILMCTPPLCEEGEVYYCPGDCPGGCGTECVTPTPGLTKTPVLTNTLQPTETPVPKPTGTPAPDTSEIKTYATEMAEISADTAWMGEPRSRLGCSGPGRPRDGGWER